MLSFIFNDEKLFFKRQIKLQIKEHLNYQKVLNEK